MKCGNCGSAIFAGEAHQVVTVGKKQVVLGMCCWKPGSREKKKSLALLLLLSSCIGAPDYYEITPMYSMSDFGARTTDFETTGLMLTLGWAPGVSRHNERMEDLAVASLSSSSGIPTAMIVDALNEHDEAPASNDNDNALPIPDVPKDAREANMMLIWVLAVMGLAMMALVGFLVKQKKGSNGS